MQRIGIDNGKTKLDDVQPAVPKNEAAMHAMPADVREYATTIVTDQHRLQLQHALHKRMQLDSCSPTPLSTTCHA